MVLTSASILEYRHETGVVVWNEFTVGLEVRCAIRFRARIGGVRQEREWKGEMRSTQAMQVEDERQKEVGSEWVEQD